MKITKVIQLAAPYAREYNAGNITMETAVARFRRDTGIRSPEATRAVKLALTAVSMGDL